MRHDCLYVCTCVMGVKEGWPSFVGSVAYIQHSSLPVDEVGTMQSTSQRSIHQDISPRPAVLVQTSTAGCCVPSGNSASLQGCHVATMVSVVGPASKRTSNCLISVCNAMKLFIALIIRRAQDPSIDPNPCSRLFIEDLHMSAACCCCPSSTYLDVNRI